MNDSLESYLVIGAGTRVVCNHSEGRAGQRKEGLGVPLSANYREILAKIIIASSQTDQPFSLPLVADAYADLQAGLQGKEGSRCD
jgi:hypothetical protein